MTTKQRAILRRMASSLEPILQIGKDGISDNSIKQVWDALEAHELIKLSVNTNSDYSARDACDEICDRTHAEPVQVIGRRFVIYRQARKDSNIKLEELC